MLPCHAIADADWDHIKHLLPGQHGGGAPDTRRFLAAVLWSVRTGGAWADLPERLGNGKSQWRRFDRGDPILQALRNPDLNLLILDSATIRAHPATSLSRVHRT